MTEFFTTEPSIYGSSVWKGCSAAQSDNEFIENEFVIRMYNKPDDDLTYCKLHNTRDEVCKRAQLRDSCSTHWSTSNSVNDTWMDKARGSIKQVRKE